MSTCKSCGAEIIWIKDQQGTHIPLNPTRVRAYDFEHSPRDGWGAYAEVGEGKPRLYHISHFLTCPNASEHSKGGK